MKLRYLGVSLLFLAFLLMAFAPKIRDAVLLGFSKQHSKKQLKLEKRFDSYLSADAIRDRLKKMSSKPNQVGSPHNKKNAEFQDSLFNSWGFNSKIEKYEVLYSTPKERVLEMKEPHHFKATLREPTLKADPSSSIRKNSIPPYNVFGADGDVTAELVYVHQGIPADYKELRKRGISVKGKIVIAQYGGSFRGVKPKLAYEHGAVGCIIYSDPEGDGYRAGDTYPKGAWRPDMGVQRGSVMNIMKHPGDPLTPGVGATKNAERISRDSSKVILKIPVLPISYKEAKPLLSALEGPVAPRSWQGALPITYHIGVGPAKVHLKIASDWNMHTIYNVVAKLKGSTYPNQWIIRGNHRDGWVFGAADPLSSNVAMSEEVKAIGRLAQTGWRPKRTIVYCSWDGEEPGIIGSTEWAETHAAELQQKAMLYINSDGNSRGFLGMGGSPSLQHFINEVGESVTDPERSVSVIQRLRARRMANGNKEAGQNKDLSIYALGGGSDYGPFLQHLGIASLSLGFGGEGGGGVYHSRYDTFTHYRRFGDPGFKYGVALSKTAGHAVLRFANADILPYSYIPMAENINTYLDQIERELKTMREETKYHNKLRSDSVFMLASDPKKKYNQPEEKSEVPYINFSQLKNALAHLKESAASYEAAFRTQMQKGISLSDDEQKKLNALLQSVAQELNSKQGLPRRSWYRNQIYAPGTNTGYGVKTLPGVREAIEQRRWNEAGKQVSITAQAINRYANHIEQASELMK